MFDNLQKYNIILGSNSPRRKELLNEIGINFSIVKIECDENYSNNLQSYEIPVFLSQKKAYNYILKNNDLLITADTIVCLNNEVLGKPSNYNEAVNMLKKLSGNIHSVFSGVCIRTIKKEKTFKVETKVKFTELEDDVIHYYVTNYKPYDKAGAYGIQEWIGKVAVESINGSFYNVMGLPIYKLIDELRKF